MASVSAECRQRYWPICRLSLGRYLGGYIDRHISVVISAESRSMCRPTYRSTLARYVNRYISQVLVDMSTDISVEECTKYTWSGYWTVDRENLRTRLCYFWWAERQKSKMVKLLWERTSASMDNTLLQNCSYCTQWELFILAPPPMKELSTHLHFRHTLFCFGSLQYKYHINW